MQIVDVARMPNRPSHLIGMHLQYDNDTCLGFDLAAVSFVNQFERMRDARVEVPAPELDGKRKRKPTKWVPQYTEEELMVFLGINPQAEDAQDILHQVMNPEAWAAFDETPPGTYPQE